MFYGGVRGPAREAIAPMSFADGEHKAAGINPESGDVPLRFRLLRWVYTDFKSVRLHTNERPLIEEVSIA